MKNINKGCLVKLHRAYWRHYPEKMFNEIMTVTKVVEFKFAGTMVFVEGKPNAFPASDLVLCKSTGQAY